jgi:thiol-disulfide isomerase/thioredoxin
MSSGQIFVRAVVALTLSLAGMGVYFLYNHNLSRRASNGLLTELGIDQVRTLLIIYFSSPTCAPCKTIQRPALDSVLKIMGNGLQVLEIDASKDPELASRWGVLSAPTTYIIHPDGSIQHINHGVVRIEKLLAQLHSTE